MRPTETLSTQLLSSLEDRVRETLALNHIELPIGHIPTEHLFGLAQLKVDVAWHKIVAPACQELFAWWGTHYSDTNLVNQKIIHQLIAEKHLLELQYLEQECPEIWLTLIKLAMLRQDLEVMVMQELAQKSHRPMLILATDLALTLGPLFNQAFLEQYALYLNNQHLFKERGSHRSGAQYVYELTTNSPHRIRKVPFKTLLPAWGKIGVELMRFSGQVKKDFASDGAQFATYLKLLATLYLSDETNHKKLHKMWQKAKKLQQKINVSNWPLNLITIRNPYFNDGLNKCEANLTIDIKTRHTKDKLAQYEPYFQTARKLVKKHHLRSKITPPHTGFLLYGSGSNTFWPNQGEAGETRPSLQ